MDHRSRARIKAHRIAASLSIVAAMSLVGRGLHADTIIEVACKPHHDQVETPVMADLSKGDSKLTGAVILIEEGTTQRLAAQVITEPVRVLCFVMPTRAQHTDTRRFRVTDARPGPEGLAIDDQSDADRIIITESKRGVLTFIRGRILKPDVPERYRRGCYLHPVYDLDGAVLTDDFPRDHFHHRGLSWAWPRVTYAGKRLDMWSIGPLHREFRKLLSKQAGPVCAVLRIVDQWVLKDHAVVDETMDICAWRAGQVGRAVDFFLTLSARDKPVTIGGELDASKGYGGFNVRFAKRRDTVLFGPNGRQPGVVNRAAMAWSDLSGKFAPGADRVSGLTIFESPGNPGHPNGWSNRSYGYLNPAWPGLGEFTLEPGRPLSLRYRVWIHRGDAVTGRAVRAQRAFVDPPSATLVSKP